jgi:nicotinamide-nucleotide amidase
MRRLCFPREIQYSCHLLVGQFLAILERRGPPARRAAQFWRLRGGFPACAAFLYSSAMPGEIPDDVALAVLARGAGRSLKDHGVMLATAESCTGGWVSQLITSVPGSSEWFERGFISYSNTAKRELLGVSTDILVRQGAVSESCARAMAEGALGHSHAQVALSITGIAGPGGGSPEKPVGTVFFAWAGRKRPTRSHAECFAGDRDAVRRQAVARALQGLIDFLGAA